MCPDFCLECLPFYLRNPLTLASSAEYDNIFHIFRVKKKKAKSEDEDDKDYDPSADSPEVKKATRKKSDSSNKSETKHEFECPQCDKTYPTWRNLVRHRRVAHEGRVFKCIPGCDKTYTERSHLKQHQEQKGHIPVVVKEEKKPEKPENNEPGKKKRRKRDMSGYAPKVEKTKKCPYCEFVGKHNDWHAHLRKDHADKNLVIFQATPLKSTRFSLLPN